MEKVQNYVCFKTLCDDSEKGDVLSRCSAMTLEYSVMYAHCFSRYTKMAHRQDF